MYVNATDRKAVLTTHRSQKITFCLSLCSSSVNVKIGGLCFLSWLDLGLLLTAASFTSCWPSPWPATRARNQLNMHRFLAVYEIYQTILQLTCKKSQPGNVLLLHVDANTSLGPTFQKLIFTFCFYIYMQIPAQAFHH